MGDILDTDPAKISEREIRLKERQNADAAKVCSIPEGRRLLRRIWVECGMKQPSYFSPNNGMMSLLAGRREVGHFVERMVKEVGLEAWHQLEREAANDQLLKELERKAEAKAKEDDD